MGSQRVGIIAKRPALIFLLLTILFAGCSNDTTEETESITVRETFEILRATQTSQAVVIATLQAPTLTATATPTPILTKTPSTATSIPTVEAATATAIPLNTPTPSATETPEIIEASIGGCGGMVEYWIWEINVKLALDQWNRIVDSMNLVIEAWNHYVISSQSVGDYYSVAGNEGFIELADNYLMTAERERGKLFRESLTGQFRILAAAGIALIDSEVAMVREFRVASATYDVDAWNHAVDLQAPHAAAQDGWDLAKLEACDYWDNR